jgi:hypothetical protein
MTISVRTNSVTNSVVQDLIEKLLEIFPILGT